MFYFIVNTNIRTKTRPDGKLETRICDTVSAYPEITERAEWSMVSGRKRAKHACHWSKSSGYCYSGMQVREIGINTLIKDNEKDGRSRKYDDGQVRKMEQGQQTLGTFEREEEKNVLPR